MDNGSTNISLIDNTIPPEQQQQPQQTSDTENSLSRRASSATSRSRWSSRPSVRGELTKRKYAKWQPHKLGIADENANTNGNGNGVDDKKRLSSDARQLSVTDGASSLGGESGQSLSNPQSRNENGIGNMDAADFASDGNEQQPQPQQQQQQQQHQQQHQQQQQQQQSTISELDTLYENQRGWFVFGIPLYSHSSLLNFDPSAWVTRDMRDSPVNITNAQVPDPSWQWAWQTWYVDMSADVDEQGWQYSFSFSSSAWHGSHPWFHSFVRRRRWVRLRMKRGSLERYGDRGRSRLEEAHMLAADYFTIHSGRQKSAGSRVPSTYMLSQNTTRVDEEPPLLEEIGNIPTLMYALKSAIVDREKIDVLKRFIEEGGDEIYYLDDKIPEIMSIFVFQTSRWQFLNHITSVINTLSRKASKTGGKESIEIQRKQENLAKAAETVRNNITGPELVADHHQSSVMGMLDLTPISKSREGSLLSKRSSKALAQKPVDNGGIIKGIPKEAEIGREGHIYQYTT